MGKSKKFGVWSVIVGLFVPIVGIALGVIGLCVSKEKKERDSAIIWNITGICVSVISWIIAAIIWSSMF